MARDFDGIDDSANAGSAAELDTWSHGPLTIALWANILGTPVTYVVSKWDGSNGWTLFNELESGTAIQITFYAVCSGTDIHVQLDMNEVQDNTWEYLAVTWDGTVTADPGVKMYVDGVETSPYTLRQSGTGSPTFADTAALVFGNRDGGGNPLNGSLAEIQIWNTVLSQSEIAAAMFGGTVIKPANRIGYWPLLGVENPEPDLEGDNPATITGAVQSSHPPGVALSLPAGGGPPLFCRRRRA